jgi:hypothetical protein
MAGRVEYLKVGPFSHDPAARPDEYPPTRPGTEAVKVVAEQCHELRVNWHESGLAERPVLEFPSLAGLATVGPPCSAARPAAFRGICVPGAGHDGRRSS